MKITNFRAENFKRLTAVSIKPSGDIVEITGKNSQGKSSVIDAIWATLGGAEAIPEVPIREGAKDAMVFLDLGDMTVTRKFRPKPEGEGFNTSLVVENKDGSRPKSPQTLLDEMMGRYSMDPLAFSRLSPKGQFDALKMLVPGLDLDAIKAQDEADYEKRTFENRKAKEARAAAAALGAKDGKVAKVDTAGMMAKLATASEDNAKLAERAARRKAAQDQVAVFRTQEENNILAIQNLRNDIAALEKRIADTKEANIAIIKEATALEIRLQNAEPLPEATDTAQLTKAISEANVANAEAVKQEQRDALVATATQHENAATALTAAMEARTEHKNAAIAAAKFPVEGLSLGNEEVLIGGLPFAQAAASQKIKTSVALAMALNPTIRVIRIEDGSLLDTDTMRTIAGMAKDHDYQIWVETVSDGKGGSGFIIEDGHIKEN